VSHASPKPHLAAALAALLVAGIALTAGLVWCRNIESRYVEALSRDLSEAKLQGVALQRAAFSQPDLLVLYGSSELVRDDIPNTAAQFFEDYPTGFRVFPVGKGGTAALSTLQKLAAVGKELAGRKVAISISPSYFFEETVDPTYYEGNFSALQAGELTFSDSLSFSLKRAIARRMLAYPSTLDDHWLLQRTLARLARGTTLDHALYYLALPLGRLQNAVGRAQDHFEATLHILDQPKLAESPEKRRRVLNWRQTLRRAHVIAKGVAAKAKKSTLPRRPHGSFDTTWLARVNKATEWTDYELLLRTLQELGARPLMLSMPVHGEDLEQVGVSPKARAAYPQRIQQLSARYSTPLVYFHEHEDDPWFFHDHFDHLGAKGWVYYNKMLDDFYHERPLTSSPNL